MYVFMYVCMYVCMYACMYSVNLEDSVELQDARCLWDRMFVERSRERS